MDNITFSNVFEQYQSFLNPVVKTNKLTVANLEKLVSFQVAALQSYVDLGLKQLKAAAEVNDPKSLQKFVSDQVEATNVVRQKWLDDVRTLADLSTGFADEFGRLARDNAAELNDKTARAADQAVKTTEQAADKVAKVSKSA